MSADSNTHVLIQCDAVVIWYIQVKIPFSIFYPISIHLSPYFGFKLKEYSLFCCNRKSFLTFNQQQRAAYS